MTKLGRLFLLTIFATVCAFAGRPANANEEGTLGDYIRQCLAAQAAEAELPAADVTAAAPSAKPRGLFGLRKPRAGSLAALVETEILAMDPRTASRFRAEVDFFSREMNSTPSEAIAFGHQAVAWRPSQLARFKSVYMNVRKSLDLDKDAAHWVAMKAVPWSEAQLESFKRLYLFAKDKLMMAYSNRFSFGLDAMTWPPEKFERLTSVHWWLSENFRATSAGTRPDSGKFALSAFLWPDQKWEKFKELYGWAGSSLGMGVYHGAALQFAEQAKAWSAEEVAVFQEAYRFAKSPIGMNAGHEYAFSFAREVKRSPMEKLEKGKAIYLDWRKKFDHKTAFDYLLEVMAR